MLRICAAMALLVWLAAVTACTTGWFEKDCFSESAKTMQAGAKCDAPQDSDKHDCHDTPFCRSLHSLCQTTPRPVLTQPEFKLVLTLNFLSTSQLVALAQSETAISRQPPDCISTFKPEVCLGPAFRSLAPPVLA